MFYTRQLQKLQLDKELYKKPKLIIVILVIQRTLFLNSAHPNKLDTEELRIRIKALLFLHSQIYFKETLKLVFTPTFLLQSAHLSVENNVSIRQIQPGSCLLISDESPLQNSLRLLRSTCLLIEDNFNSTCFPSSSINSIIIFNA